ncbi:MAG: hypothetical protein NC086_10300 [Alistipes sp.]|nr:hypothetical protein [Alistipes sp.]
MAVSPIDITMMQRLNEVSQIKHNEMTRPDVEQATITQNIEKQVYVQSEQVVHQADSTKANTDHDAREKGKNSYFASNGKKKKKKEEPGTIKIKGKSSFDMKI